MANILTKIKVTYAGEEWLTYSTNPNFTLSEGYGEKIVYFRVKNAYGNSPIVNDSILYLADYTWLARGRYKVRRGFTSLARGKYKLIYTPREWLGGGAYRILGVFLHTAKGQYRIANDDLERYELYCGVDSSPDFESDPLETFTSLPHDTPALDPEHTYYFVLRKRNKWNLLSQNIAEWTVTVDAAGEREATTPSAPVDIALTPDENGKVKLIANYYYLEDSEEATKFLIYLTNDGSDPDPDVDTPTEVDMVKVDGIAKLDWLSSEYANGTTIKIIVRTRRIDAGPVNVDSVNTDIYTTTASTEGPDKTEPAGIFFKDIAEQKQSE